MTRVIRSSAIPQNPDGRPRRRDKARIRIPSQKSELNPTIVTVIGAGIAGLAAAHELAERGCLVQVVEREASEELPGEVEVGGMAASQYGRVKPAIEDLHVALIKAAHDAEKHESRRHAITLLELIDYTRRPFVQTEKAIGAALVMGFTTESGEAELWRPFSPSVSTDDAAWETYIDECVDELWRGLVARRRRLIENLSPRRYSLINTVLKKFGSSRAGTLRPPVTLPASPQLLALAESTSANFEAELIKHLLATNPDKRIKDALSSEMAEEALRREILLVEVRGHAWREDHTSTSHRYSLNRAQQLLRVLSHTRSDDKWKAVSRHITAVGMGVREPLTERRTEEATRRNRRAEVVVIERLFPGEHGFRVFPRHYGNTFDVMRRIPVRRDGRGEGAETVLDALRPTTLQALGVPWRSTAAAKTQGDAQPPGQANDEDQLYVQLLRRRARSLEELRRAIGELFADSGVTEKDVAYQQLAVSKVLTMCNARRWCELDPKSWREYLGIGGVGEEDQKDVFGNPRYSDEMKRQITSAAQSLLAYSAGEADAHSYGNFAAQLIADQFTNGAKIDRLLTGPTTEAWLLPWKRYLRAQGVQFYHGELETLEVRGSGELVPRWKPRAGAAEARPDSTKRRRKQSSARVPAPERIDGRDGPEYLGADNRGAGNKPDFYVLALSLNAANKVSKDLEITSPEQGRDLLQLRAFFASAEAPLKGDDREPGENTSAQKWMSGLQFFYETPVSLATAHVYYPWSEWGISAISQTNYWNNRPSQALGFLGVVSIDICDWFGSSGGPNLLGLPHAKPAKHSSPLEVAVGSWAQIYEVGSPSTLSSLESDFSGPYAAGFFETVSPRSSAQGQRQSSKSDETARLIQIPNVFHLDRGLEYDPERGAFEKNNTRYLAARKGEFHLRPGLSENTPYTGDGAPPEVKPAINFGRWVLAGSFMATHTRMMTMEASIESGRNAAAQILRRRDSLTASKHFYEYNGRRAPQAIQPPSVTNIEDEEIEELKPLKRLDQRLFDAGLPHVFEILQLEKRLDLMLRARALQNDQVKLAREQQKLNLELDASPLGRVFDHAVDQMSADWPNIVELQELKRSLDSTLDLLERRTRERSSWDAKLGKPRAPGPVLNQTRIERALRELLGIFGDPGVSAWKEREREP